MERRDLLKGVVAGGLASTLNDTEFKADAVGNYEIILSAEKVAGNWMPLPKGAQSVTTRHYYERERSIGNEPLHHIPIAIENLDDPGPRPAPSDAGVAAGQPWPSGPVCSVPGQPGVSAISARAVDQYFGDPKRSRKSSSFSTNSSVARNSTSLMPGCS